MPDTTQTITDRLLRSLQRPKPSPAEISDGEVRGLQVRASKQGVVSFSVLKRPPGSRKLARFPIGTYPLTSLAEARKRAREVLREIEHGTDPRARKAEQARAAAAAKASSFAAVAEAFIRRHVAHKRTARDIEARIRRELIPRWGERPITSITRADVIALIDEIVDRGHPEAARQGFVYTRRLFKWAVTRYDLLHTPTDHLSVKDLIGIKKARQRVLSDAEIELIWCATEGPEAAYYGPYIRLLLLLGVRRTELGRATWLEFDLDAKTWTIPPGRMKSDAPHIVPLPSVAVDILRSLLHPLARGKDYAIGRRIHYVRAKDRLDARIKQLNGKVIPAWRLHDLRRTFRTGLSRVGIAPHIAELCIAHRQPALHQIYDQHSYATEKRFAFDKWAAHVLRIVQPPEGVVVPLRPAG